MFTAHRLSICFFLSSLLMTVCPVFGMEGREKVGFLLVAPDRGFLGNREVQAVYEAFRKEYPLPSPGLVANMARAAGSMRPI